MKLFLCLFFFTFVSACTGIPNGVVPVKNFDINRYQGLWYEIFRLDHSFEKGLTNVTANYKKKGNGEVAVTNRGFNRKTCQWDEVTGIAKFQGTQEVASLSVSFFWPFWGGYHVFALDKKDYNYALISGPSYDYLWILARQPKLNNKIKKWFLREALLSGFDIKNLIEVDHTKPDCKKKK